MKTIKKFMAISFFFAAVLCFATIGASALEKGDIIEWTYVCTCEEVTVEEKTYIGTLKEGKNVIDTVFQKDDGFDESECDDSTVYEFEVKQSGYYLFGRNEIGLHIAETYENGKAKNSMQREFISDKNKKLSQYIYYLEKGTVLVCIESYGTPDELTVEYCGQIDDVTFQKEDIEDLIMEEDVFYDYYGYLIISAPHTISFSNGKQVKNYYSFTGYLKQNEINLNSENTITIHLLNFRKEITINIYDVTYFVESVEVENAEKYAVAYLLYNGETRYERFGDTPEKITFNFTDGTSKTIEYYSDRYEDTDSAYVTFPSGRKYPVYGYCHLEDGKECFCINIAYHCFTQKECKTVKVGFKENAEALNGELKYCFNQHFDNIYRSFQSMTVAQNPEDFVYHLKGTFDMYYIKAMFNEAVMFLKYYAI